VSSAVVRWAETHRHSIGGRVGGGGGGGGGGGDGGVEGVVVVVVVVVTAFSLSTTQRRCERQAQAALCLILRSRAPGARLPRPGASCSGMSVTLNVGAKGGVVRHGAQVED